MGLRCGKEEDYSKQKKCKRSWPPIESLYSQGLVRILNKSHATVLVDASAKRFRAPTEEMNTAVAGSGQSPEHEYDLYRYISTPNSLITMEPGTERLMAPGTDTAYVTIFQKKERMNKIIRGGQEEEFLVSLCENHPVRIGCTVQINDGWMEIFPENYVWEYRMGPTVEIESAFTHGVYVKVDIDEPHIVAIPVSEMEGPWFCTNWFHKIYYRKYVPPGYSFLQKDMLKWYLPPSKKTKRKIFITVVRTDDEGLSTSRISRKELSVLSSELKKRGGLIIRIRKDGKIIPDAMGM